MGTTEPYAIRLISASWYSSNGRRSCVSLLAVRERYGSGFYETIGRKGGQATRERHGAQFYESIGQKGGKVVKEKYGSDFYEEIGHKGGQKVKRLIAEAKKTLSESNGKV